MKSKIMKGKLCIFLLAIVATFSCEKEVKQNALALPENFEITFSNTMNTIQAEWELIENAKSYTVELSNAQSDVLFVNQTIEPKAVFNGLNAGTAYFIRIKANIGNANLDSPYSNLFPISTKLSAPAPVLTYSNGSSLAFTWNTLSTATTYEVELSTGDGTIVKTEETAETSYEFTGLQEEVSYRFRIRALSASSASDYSAYLTAVTTVITEGFPVSWVFAEVNSQKDYLDKTLNPAALQTQQPNWLTKQELKSETLRGYNSDAILSVVNASGQMNGYGFNNGHPYLKGMMNNDYWLYTIPVKNLKANTTITLKTNVTGSGSGPGPFIIEWSTDKTTWIAAGAKTETIVNGPKNETVTYTYFQGDNLNTVGQPISQDIKVTQAVEEGHLYIRLRVSADIRIAKNGSGIVNSGSTRLMSRQLIVLKNE